MAALKAFAFLALLLGAVTASAETPVPATVEFMFDPAAPQGIKTEVAGDAGYLKGIRQGGGAVTNGWWHVASTAAFGQGSLQFEIDRKKLAGDLALILHADWQKDTDVAVQLYDAQGRAIALDLFGEMRRNAKMAGTDTFIIPMDRYPDATSVVVRRLSGDLRIVGGGLFPVLSEITSKAENEKALATQLGVMISPHHWMFSRSGQEAADSSSANALGNVHAITALDQSNAIGAAVLKQPNYPVFRPVTSGQLAPPQISASNTTDFMIKNVLRTIALRSGGKLATPFMTSSDGVAIYLLEKHYNLGFMSVPMSSAEKEKFFRQNGYPIVEVQFARDALEILVHASNQVNSITVPQLDAIYGSERRAGAPAAITNWSELGGSGEAIKAIGGQLNWGTTRTFQQLVLKGGVFRDDMEMRDVVYSNGVEKSVAEGRGAIGFATLRPRRPDVRAISVAANSGERAYGTNADDIYSGKYPLQRMFYAYISANSLDQSGLFERELINLLLSDVGQTLVARAGSLPLMASEVVAERAKLGLPQ
jgi:phosphate transport system substrate-binding protein